MPEEDPVNPISLKKINHEIRNITCGMQLITILIVLIFIIQFLQMANNTSMPFSGLISILLVIGGFFLLAAICIIFGFDKSRPINTVK